MTNPSPSSISICDPDPPSAFYTISWDAFNTGATNPRIDIPLPSGASYLSGSLSDLTAPSGGATSVSVVSGNTLRISFPDLPALESGSLQFKLVYDCDITSQLSGLVQLAIQAIADEGTNTSTSSPINNTVSEPFIIANPGSQNAITGAEVGDTYTGRSFFIRQTGLDPVNLYEFEVCITYDGDISVSNQAINGVSVSSLLTATGGCITVNSSLIPGVFPMNEADQLTWTEDVQIDGCDDLATNVTVNFGCGSSDCQSDQRLTMSVALENNTPSVSGSTNTRTFGACIEDGAQIVSSWTINSGKAYDLQLTLQSRSTYTFIDTSSIEVDYGSGYVDYNGAISNVSTSNTGASCIPSGERFTSMRLESQSGPFDATSGPITISVRYTIKTCCPTGSCTVVDNSILGSRTTLAWEDMCGLRRSSRRDISPENMGTTTADQIPTYLSDGQSGIWQYDFIDMANINDFASLGQVCMDFTLDSRINFNASSIRWVDAGGANAFTPVSVDVSSYPTVLACFDVGDYHGDGSRITYEASYTCAPANCNLVANTDMSIGFRFGNGSCTDNCLFTFLCESGTTILGGECCPGVCDGIEHQGISVSRTCFGQPDNDNDGCADPGGSIDLNLVRTERAMTGDELQFTAIGEINMINASDSFNYVYLELLFPSAHEIGTTTSFEIYDASAATSYTCNGVNVFNVGDTLITYYLTTDLIRNCGTVPADFKYENGDSLTLTGTFVNIDNPGCTVEQLVFSANWFADRAASPVGADRLQCNPNIPGTYSQVGYAMDIFPRTNSSYGCGGAQFEYEVDFCIGGRSYRNQPFPYEIRNFMQPTESGLKIPDGLVLDQLLLEDIRFTKFFGSGHPGVVSSVDITSLAQVSNGYLVLDWANYFDDCTNRYIPNGAYSFEIRGRFEGSCASETSLPEWYYEATMDFCSPAVPDQVIRVDSFHGSNLNIVIPDLQLSTSGTTIFPISETAQWSFSLRETNGSNANNAWLIFISPSGNIVPVTVTRGSTTFTPTNGIYQLGNIPSGQIYNYTIEANYADCNVDSLIVVAGWDCTGYPISDQQVIQGGLPCPVDELSLFLEPEDPAIQQQILTEPQAPLVPCSDTTYVLEIKNVDRAVIYEPEFELYIPYTSGLELIAGTEQACYPCDPSSPVYNYNLFAPTEIIYTPLGIKYVWNLENLITEFDWNNGVNPRGWEGEAQSDESLKRFRIRFDARTSCEFIAGDYMNFRTKGHTFCGKDVETILRNGVQLFYNTPPPSYNAFMTLTTEQPINGCSEGNGINLDGTVVFFGDTDGNDTLIIAIPSALQYSSIIFNPSQVSSTPVINTIGPGAGNQSFEEIRVGIDAGIPLGTPINFQLNVTTSSDGVLCEEPNAVNIRTVRSTSFLCRGTPCDGLTSTGTIYPLPILDLVKDSFVLKDFSVSTNCGMTLLTVDNLTVENTGEFAIDKDITIDFYHDADGSKDLSTGDVLLGSTTSSANVDTASSVSITAGPFTVPPERSCAILAVASGCNCEPVEIITGTVRTDNAGNNQQGCSSDTFTLGCTEDLRTSSFSYQWFGLNGAPVDSLSDPNDPNATLSYTHFNDSPITLDYVLLTTHPGGDCNNVDTVSLTFDGVAATQGPDIKICTDSIGYFTGPTGFFDYRWSPTVGVADTLDPLSAVAAPVGGQVYTLTYRDLDGCGQVFRQNVQGVICTDLELDKSVSPAVANIGEVLTYELTLVNRGPNGASGVEVRDTLPSGLTFLSANPASQYDAAANLWTIPGIVLPNDTFRLLIYAQVIDGGPVFNSAEVSNMNEGDLDSTPGNDDPNEDDQDGVCTGVAVELSCRQVKRVGIANDFTIYEWYKDGALISGANTDSLDITEPGTYEVRVDGGNCPYNQCCPFVVTEEACAGIGDFVWEDLDNDGVQDAGENGIAGVTVILYDGTNGQPIDTAVTDASGNYLFEELPSGTYYVDVDISTNTSGVEYTASPQNNGGDDNLDSDASAANGQTSPFAFDATNGDDTSVDAGFVPQADIGNYVWVDQNRNGLQDFGEPVVQNVTVTLYDANTNAIVSTTTTNASGEYLFNDVPFGTYYVLFDLSSTSGFTDYSFTSAATGDGSNDSEADTSGRGPNFVFDPRGGNDLTHDAGIFPLADIGDFVWEDTDGDGIQDGGEPGVQGVTVILYDADTGNPVDTVVTDASGQYTFEDVPSGNYYITFDETTNTGGQQYVWSPSGQGTGSNDSEADPQTGQTPSFSFDAALGDDVTRDAGLIPTANVGDYVWVDTDRDGIQDASESGLENVQVILYDANTNNPLDTVFTDAAGAYQFTDVRAGDYYVVFDPSTNSNGFDYTFSSSGRGNGANDSEANSIGQGPNFTFNPGSGDDLTHDAGL
ncbi:MAG: SdrD B-like domain-containing protein, partial [Bacteroidota bacterium]